FIFTLGKLMPVLKFWENIDGNSRLKISSIKDHMGRFDDMLGFVLVKPPLFETFAKVLMIIKI
ncbi:hypothetical protein, partial [Pricia sp.]|uniref:hypothetical protein n=1 Tax=Pricia sp. TaxID=2268138 RepID=UPI0035936C40